ncbi:MAG: type III secretion inner membrane ring lipoprotein SctJ [Hyphomicrobiales bacterium]|nr:type III secretion inner membrane ring lipoprotein SctJ [Hyphomicrobiales bacterium]
MRRRWHQCLLVSLLAVGLVGCNQIDLYRNLSEREANEIVSILIFQNISATKEADAKNEFYTVRVHEASLARAVQILKTMGYPREQRESIGDVFKPSGLVPTPFEEQVRFTYAMNQELERTISLMQGVIDVRVHIVLSQPGQASSEGAARASVLLNYDSAHDFTDRVPAIKRLVSDAVDNILYENVEVLATPVRTTLAGIGKLQVQHVLGIGVMREDRLGFLLLLGGLALLWLVTAALLAGLVYSWPGGWRAILKSTRLG